VNVPKFKGKRQDGVVTGVDSVGVRISHDDDGDLLLFLVSPGGRAIALSTYRDQSTDNSGNGYGAGPANCSGSLVSFGDASAGSITTPGNTGNGTPITGSFRPEQPLSTFGGGPARGFWTLIVYDNFRNDVGQINALSLDLTYRYRTKAKRKK
jgi:subtilisin-like proprotein convertase family protein